MLAFTGELSLSDDDLHHCGLGTGEAVAFYQELRMTCGTFSISLIWNELLQTGPYTLFFSLPYSTLFQSAIRTFYPMQTTLRLDPESGWMQGIEHIASSNYNQRPSDEVSLLILHNISLPPGQFGTGMVDALFTNQLPAEQHPYFQEIKTLRVSAHFLIERDGKIKQYVSCHNRAWHAGISSFHGRENCNDYSIGIELEGTDWTPYTNEQYQQLRRLIKEIKKHFPLITDSRICGHSDVAPGRKTDPGPTFDWKRIR